MTTPNDRAALDAATALYLHIKRHWRGASERGRWMKATRLTLPLLVTALFLTGCYTYTQAPGATGKVIDAAMGQPICAAEVTRPRVAGSIGGRPGVPSEALPAATVTTDRNGRFNLPPAMQTQIAFMYLHNPPSISGMFLVTAPGYGTNEVEGVATSRGFWRADLGLVALKKP
jgi:hypothetical protein